MHVLLLLVTLLSGVWGELIVEVHTKLMIKDENETVVNQIDLSNFKFIQKVSLS